MNSNQIQFALNVQNIIFSTKYLIPVNLLGLLLCFSTEGTALLNYTIFEVREWLVSFFKSNKSVNMTDI